LAYVALTRSQHQAVVWWAGSRDSRDSALGRLLFARDAEGNVAPFGRATPTDADARARFEELALDAPGCISVETSDAGEARRWSEAGPSAVDLQAASFDRALDTGWRRTSYSDITALAHEARVSSEPEEPVVADEPDEDAAAAVGRRTGDAVAARRAARRSAAMPSGVDIGTFIHRVLEATDFAAPDLDAELGRAIAAVRARRPLDIGDARGRRRAARRARDAARRLGCRLRDVARADRLDELVFELPLAGGDEPTGSFALDALGALLREHLARRSAARLRRPPRDPELRAGVRGYLTGSIDLVVRAGDEFLVVDYKTNGSPRPTRSRPRGTCARPRSPPRWSARTTGCRRCSTRARCTATCAGGCRTTTPTQPRRRALPVPARDDGRARARPCGVFAWRPPARSVAALSDVLDRGAGGMSAAARSVRPARRSTRPSRCARSTRPACWRRPTCTSRSGWPLRRRWDERRRAGRGARRARPAARPRLRRPRDDPRHRRGRGEEPVDLHALPWPEPRLARAGRGRARSPTARCASRAARSTSTATGARKRRLAADLRALADAPPAAVRPRLPRPTRASDAASAAAERRVRRRFAVVAGGPGTGKTTTVARIVLALVGGAAPRR
jgi:hypothetical protein